MSEMKVKLLQNRIDEILKYFKPLLPLSNCHMVDYITENHFEKLIPKEITREIKEHGMPEAVNAFWSIREEISNRNYCKKDSKIDTILSSNEYKDIQTKFKNLFAFVEKADRHCLKPDGVLCFSAEDFQKKLGNLGADNKDSLKIKEFMSEKKSHEVEVLSKMVATLSSWAQTTHTVDLGGGKGVLSAMLTMFFKMKVLNIDCCPLNAKGAEERNIKLQKLWPGVKKKAEQLKSGIIPERKGRSHSYRKTKHNAENKIKQTESKQINDDNTPSDNLNVDINQDITNISEDFNSGIVLHERLSGLSIKNEVTVENVSHDQQKRPVDSLYRHVTEFVTSKTYLFGLVTDNFNSNKESEDIKLLLTGLHTCGDLGSTALRLFQECSSSLVLCAVPCCYHLITEKSDPYSLTECPTDEMAGFPLSNYLRGVNIGRNARMLASQSVDRVTATRQLPSDSLFYRALLQVTIKLNNNTSTQEGRMKKVGEKCKNFTEYVAIATEKMQLNFENSGIQDLEEFSLQNERHRSNLIIFYLLRMCLAPVVESLIFYDRLMFLAENGFANRLGDCFIVKMFDPVVSPRCHSLVAYRKF